MQYNHYMDSHLINIKNSRKFTLPVDWVEKKQRFNCTNCVSLPPAHTYQTTISRSRANITINFRYRRSTRRAFVIKLILSRDSIGLDKQILSGTSLFHFISIQNQLKSHYFIAHHLVQKIVSLSLSTRFFSSSAEGTNGIARPYQSRISDSFAAYKYYPSLCKLLGEEGRWYRRLKIERRRRCLTCRKIRRIRARRIFD